MIIIVHYVNYFLLPVLVVDIKIKKRFGDCKNKCMNELMF